MDTNKVVIGLDADLKNSTFAQHYQGKKNNLYVISCLP